MFWEIFIFGLSLLILLWIYTLPDPNLRRIGNQLPGPFAFPIIGCVTNIPKNGEEQIKLAGEKYKEYGKIWRIWVGNQLYVASRDERDMEVILSSKSNITKSSVYNMLHSWLGTGLLTSTGEKWAKRRKAITPAFHFQILEQFVDTFNKHSKTLVQVLNNFCGQSFNVHPLISSCTLDVICETSMGIDARAQTQRSDYVSAVRKITSLISERIRTPWLHLNFVYGLLRSHKEVEKTISILHEHTLKVIRDKRNFSAEEEENEVTNDLGIKKKIPLLETLLKLKDTNSSFTSDQDIREEVDTFMFEGHDTTASAISFLLHFLSKDQKIQNRLFEEVQNTLGDKSDPTYEDLLEMKYLDCVIKESLRLCPSVPIIGRQITEEVTLKSGYTLPVGTVLLLSIFWLHRDEKNFPNPYEFNPDNFLPEATAKRGPFAYLPFSAGPRNCIGQKFAMAEMKSVISRIVLNYTLKEGDGDLRLQSDIVLQSVNGHNIILHPRNN